MIQYKFLVILIGLFFVQVAMQAQDEPDIQAVKNKTLPYQYWVHYPKGYHDKINKKKKYPLVMYLHGRSIMGTDLEKVKRYGVIYEIIRGLELDFIVIAPQCQKGWENSKLIEILDYAENNYRVNQQEVYLTGMSMGGYGAWYLAGAHPDRFAAVAPVAGGGRTKDAENLKNLPHWVFHGSKDKPVPIEESKKMVKAIRAAGNKEVKFTIRNDWGHSEAIRAFRMPELYSWFLQHQRNTSSKDNNSIDNEPIIAIVEDKKPAKEEPLAPMSEDKNPNTDKEEELADGDYIEPLSPEEIHRLENKKEEETITTKKDKNQWWKFWNWKIFKKKNTAG
ncbi:MAG: prolyl oligopeptidase family serine peptidase [Saprospiraceae bacterium]|nr:prolyl oligopeptidase family serine peptidase [Saprospiraceae bacterium]